MSKLPVARHCFWGRLWGLAALAVLSIGASSFAAEKYGNSLDWTPADVSFYSSSMRVKEQIDIVAASNAWKKFREIPSVAEVWRLAEEQLNNPQGPAAMGLQLMRLPENQQLLQMLGDMFSQEVVVYGGPKIADCLELFQLVNAAQRQGNIDALRAARQEDGPDASTGQARAVLKTLQEHKDLLKTPDLLFAFKLVDPQAAKTQLERLKVLATIGFQQSPFPDRFKIETVGDAEYLTITLDGSLVPWDEAPWGQYEEQEGEFKTLREALEKLRLVIALGVRGDYLILSIDESTDHLAKLGEGPVLAGVKEFAPLARFRDRKLVSVAYMSDALAKRAQMSPSDVDQIVEQVGTVLDAAGVNDEKLRVRIASDVEKLGNDVKKFIPKPGAVMGFNFLTPTGYEGYSYNWSQNLGVDGSQPLPLANHVGGDPVLAVVSRAKYDPQVYETLVKWSKVGFNYFEEFALPQMKGEERENAAKALEIAKPLLARADKVTREMLIPSLKDGQGALVLDAKISSKQWHKEMPPSAQALPMLELGVVMGISDAKLFKQAMREYKTICDDLVKKIREVDPKAIPADYQVPSPESTDTDGGTVFTYKLPAEAGLDDQVAPSGGVGEKVAVFTTSPRLAAKVLASTPITSQTLIGSAVTKPCATVIFFNWPALVDGVTPWVEFAIREHGPGAAEEDPDQIAKVLSQVRTGMEILKCWRTTESVTTIEDGVTVAHTVTTFKDLE